MLAAWLLFKVVDVHPFIDGNGRMCRLLANRVLAMIFPFPVPIYAAAVGTEDPSTIDVEMKLVVECHALHLLPRVQSVMITDLRRLYLVLLEVCRPRPAVKDQPIELCALLVENGWYHWRHALASVPSELLLPYDHIGTMVVFIPPVRRLKGKQIVEQSLAEFIHTEYRALNHSQRRSASSEADWNHEANSVLRRAEEMGQQLRAQGLDSMEDEHTVAEGVRCRIVVRLRC